MTVDLNMKQELLQEELDSLAGSLRADCIVAKKDDEGLSLTITHSCRAVYGLGERFNGVNVKGSTVITEVIEKFCNQGEVSYCPVPFFFTDNCLGVYVAAETVCRFCFGTVITAEIRRGTDGTLPKLYFFTGSPREIISAFTNVTGRTPLVPRWSLGPWMSANRWSTQTEVMRQAELARRHGIPVTAAVIEAWSDEATFYRFNDHGEWEDPSEMVRSLKEQNIHTVLWQIPVLKRMDNNEPYKLLDDDKEYAVKMGYCIKRSDGTPYTIPENHWFSGSYLIDFTNEEARRWWFDKRRYLLEMGVDGFKTDGGEFILNDDAISYSGLGGKELRNLYAAEYVKAYSEFVGADRVLFSRAGYTGQQKYPIQWAGDQMSTWEEFAHVLSAGLSIGLSGVALWSFDIAGFAGDLPCKALYESASQTAVFVPVMQFHSEPPSGQFSEVYSAGGGNNDRSPWNLAGYYNDEDLIMRMRYFYNLRMNLLPYIYEQLEEASRTGVPIMRHLVLDYPSDENVFDIDDEFMLGDILVAPFMNDKRERVVYLPEGNYCTWWSYELECCEPVENDAVSVREDGSIYVSGGGHYHVRSVDGRLPVFIREGAHITLNLSEDGELGSSVGNQTEGFTRRATYIAGKKSVII